MNNHAPGQEDSFDELVYRQRANLQPGGPAVDYAVIHAFIDGDLAEAERAEVARRIDTWTEWHDAYWETRALLDCYQSGVAETSAANSTRGTMPAAEAAVESIGRSGERTSAAALSCAAIPSLALGGSGVTGAKGDCVRWSFTRTVEAASTDASATGVTTEVVAVWTTEATLSVRLREPALGPDIRFEVIWLSPTGEVRAKGLVVDTVELIRLRPADNGPPAIDDRLAFSYSASKDAVTTSFTWQTPFGPGSPE